MRRGVSIVLLLTLLVALVPAHVMAQGDVVCESDVVVQSDDWLSKIAEKVYGDVLAFPAIAEATNTMAASDDSYTAIDDVNIIEVGWKLCIPAADVAGEVLTADTAMMASGLPDDAAEEQTLRVVTGSSGVSGGFSFYPLAGGGSEQTWFPLQHVPPLYFDVNQELQPGVFASWESNADSTVWIFRIDPRAQWSDGTPITAEQVKGTWELMTDPLTEMGRIPQYIGNVQGYDAVREQATTDMTGLEVIDERTLQVTLNDLDPIFHWRIATAHMNPVKVENAIGNLDTFWLPESNPAVSGPYVLSEFDPDLGTATMVPNPNWWMDTGPFLDSITFEFVEDQQTLAILAQNNQIDVSADQLPLTSQQQLPDWFTPIKEIGFNSFWIAATNPPTDDPKVREALLLSVNIDDVFQAAWPQGGANRATQMLDPNVSCYETDKSWYDYNPEAAQAALAASSYGSAENLPKLRVTPRSTNPELNRAMEAVLEFWRQNLGITNIEFKTRPAEFGPDEENVNISRDDVVIRFPDGATYAWVASHSAGPVARGEMMRGYQNAEVDALLDEAQVIDPEDPRRCELTRQAQELFMNDHMGIFFGVPIRTINASSRVQNFDRGPDVSVIAPWRIYLTE